LKNTQIQGKKIGKKVFRFINGSDIYKNTGKFFAELLFWAKKKYEGFGNIRS